MPDYILALIAQIPLVAAFFWGLQRGLFHTGREFDQLRDDLLKQAAYREALLAIAIAERKDAEERLDALRETMKDATDVLAQSVALNERLLAELAKRT